MKAILLITDSEAMREFERVLVAEGHHGFTVMPAVAGSGRRGLKTGDRVHPGSSSLLLTVVGDRELAPMLELLRGVRERVGGPEASRLWSFSVDEVA